jgi:hypothetical protein
LYKQGGGLLKNNNNKYMKKIYLKLTKEQRKRGVIFSSCLKGGGMDETIHEVKETDEDKHEIIKRLKDDRFFNNSPFKYNEIRK